MIKLTDWFGEERSKAGDVVVGYALAAGLLVLPLFVGPYLLEVWSALEAAAAAHDVAARDGAPADDSVAVAIWFASQTLTIGVASIWLASLAGALGGTLHGIVSLTSYIGNQRFFARWSLWYLSRPVNGAMTGGIFVAVLQGGLVADAAELNMGGIVAMGAVAGLFSKQAVDRLRKVIEAFLGAENDHREDKLEGDDDAGDADAADTEEERPPAT